MKILIHQTAAGRGLPLPQRANDLDAGVDVRTAKTMWLWPAWWLRLSGRRNLIPLGFVYRWEPRIFERDGSKFTRTIEVVKKGSGIPGVDPQAVIFDGGFFPPLNDPEGISLVVALLSLFPIRIKRGQKIAQLVVREVVLDEFVEAPLENLEKIKQLDNRGAGKLGSSGK